MALDAMGYAVFHRGVSTTSVFYEGDIQGDNRSPIFNEEFH